MGKNNLNNTNLGDLKKLSEAKENSDKICGQCKVNISKNETLCLQCHKLKKEHDKKVASIVAPLIIVVTIIIMVSILREPSASVQSPNKTTPIVQQINFVEINNLIQEFEEVGLIKKINPSINEAYVDLFLWSAMNVEQKKITARALSYYVGYEKGTDIYWVDILDWQSGVKLAGYSNAYGFKAY